MIIIPSVFSQNAEKLELVGRCGEGGTRQIAFDCTDVLAEYPDAQIICAMQRTGDKKAYLKHCTADGMKRVITLEPADVFVPGMLRIELRALIGDDVRKSAVYIAQVADSLRGEKDAPGNPVPDSINRIDKTLKSAEETQEKLNKSLAQAEIVTSAADAAAQNAQNVANTVQIKLENGDFVGAKGDKGDPGNVQDVRVAGVSVLKDGVANVPIATADAPGVVSVPTQQDSGIWNDNGKLRISYATDAEISGRNGTRKSIVCANMDYAVKAAMCDGKGAAWTAADQAAARERMGVDKTYELIEEITLTEEVTQLIRNAEPNGTAYHFRNMYVNIITPQAKEEGVIYSKFTNIPIGLAMNSITSQVPEGGIAQIYAPVDDGFLDGYGVGTPNLGTSSNFIRYLTPLNVPSGISAINSINILATVNIPINTNIKIYGVRA